MVVQNVGVGELEFKRKLPVLRLGGKELCGEVNAESKLL